jgi:two-component system chemotaxis response regulator CheB
MPQRCIVIGASAGGVEALKDVVSKLPGNLPAAVFVVLHIPPFVASSLPRILSRSGPLRAVHPKDGERIKPGVIYVAPPDHHLLVGKGTIVVTKGPKENRFRPSIDALFRSAAYMYGSGAIGVILSGALDDGTSGLWSIKRLGGITIVQKPDQARFESMPRSAMEYVQIDHLAESTEIGALIEKLIHDRPKSRVNMAAKLKKLMAIEIEIAGEGGALQKGIMDFGSPTPLTCPECHGTLVRLKEGKTSRYRCHTGHGYTDSALLEAVMKSTGESIWQVMRSLEEGAMLLSHMAEQLTQAGDHARAKIFSAKAKVLEQRSKVYHQDVLDHESLSGDNLGQKR